MRRVLLVLAGIAVLLFGSAAVASAEPVERSTAEVAPMAAPPGCNATNVCFWVNNNFNDGPGRLAGTNPDFRRFAHRTCGGGTWNDCVSSVYNNGTRCWAYLWDGFNYTLGARGNIGLNRGVGITNLGAWGFDNAASSNSWANCT